ncbi:MAG: hypothetical protein K940chlam7_01090 [Chlamydiae bacterium]|nr:hypothetical protein [Chlamydiota bacterium]
MTVSVIIDSTPYQTLPGTFASPEVQRIFVEALRPFKNIIELSGNTQAEIEMAIEAGTYHTELRNGITTLLALADPQLTSEERTLLGRPDSELTVEEKKQKGLIKQRFLTVQMAKALDVLLRTLRAAGVPTDASAITTDQVIAWKNLSDNTTAIQEVLDIAASLVHESAVTLGKTESLQSLIELVYVKTGNEVLFETMEGLETGLDSTQRALETMVKLQDLHNKITAEEKSFLVTEKTTRTISVTMPTEGGGKDDTITSLITVEGSWPTEWEWNKAFRKQDDHTTATFEDILEFNLDSDLFLKKWVAEGAPSLGGAYDFIDPSLPLSTVDHPWKADLATLNADQNEAFDILQTSYADFIGIYTMSNLTPSEQSEIRVVVDRINTLLNGELNQKGFDLLSTTGFPITSNKTFLTYFNLIFETSDHTVDGFPSDVSDFKSSEPFVKSAIGVPDFYVNQMNELDNLITAFNTHFQTLFPGGLSLKQHFEVYLAAIDDYNTEIDTINVGLQTIIDDPDYVAQGFTGVTLFGKFDNPAPPPFWDQTIEQIYPDSNVVYFTDVDISELYEHYLGPPPVPPPDPPIPPPDPNTLLPNGIVFYPGGTDGSTGMLVSFGIYVDPPTTERLNTLENLIFRWETFLANSGFPIDEQLSFAEIQILDQVLETVRFKLEDGDYTTEGEMFQDLTDFFTQVNETSPPAFEVIEKRALAIARAISTNADNSLDPPFFGEEFNFPIRTGRDAIPTVLANAVLSETDPADIEITITNANFLAQFTTKFTDVTQDILDLIEELKTIKEFYDKGVIPRDTDGEILVDQALEHSLLGRLIVLRDDINDAGTFEAWLFDSYREGNQITGMNPGEIQRNITAALSAGQSLNDQQKEEVRRFLFIFEEYYKSSAAILNKITQIIEKMAQGIAR